ncbi:peptide-N-glycosidase F-related protein [Flavobacterium sp.]|uniref:peptide-N-glycosidase F-related protein n=1 Tax=Flavobacterium sp. TaxID=239 RepID=UPI00286B5400|nr:peptide-N-glycosidase F-related protein [Flavobacterium sp.]
MKKTLLILFVAIFNCIAFNAIAQTTTLTVFDQIRFYDGYAAVVNQPVPDGIIRHRNDLYAKKLSPEELLAFGSTMTLNVTIKADCDNYDRIGNVNLAFVPKDATTYDTNAVPKFELARFITPFMNKNIAPFEVPYTFNIDNMAKIFKDPALIAAYDFWIEFEVFGVPYAAQTQVAGCAGINSVFFGTLALVSDSNPFTSSDNFILPLNFKNYLNNYQVGASDAVGTTVRTISMNLPTDIADASFYLITSNHGANSGGEEYVRRRHYIYFDNFTTNILNYRPGELTCEPYRVYNTQGNGIYGATPRTDAQWQSFSNWCPGYNIPIRKLVMGTIIAGTHNFRISVPTAVFTGGEGYFPISLYLQGTNTALGLDHPTMVEYAVFPNPTSDFITIDSGESIKNSVIVNSIGQKVYEGNLKRIDISSFSKGLYLLQIEFENNMKVTEKVIKN